MGSLAPADFLISWRIKLSLRLHQQPIEQSFNRNSDITNNLTVIPAGKLSGSAVNVVQNSSPFDFYLVLELNICHSKGDLRGIQKY